MLVDIYTSKTMMCIIPSSSLFMNCSITPIDTVVVVVSVAVATIVPTIVSNEKSAFLFFHFHFLCCNYSNI